MYTKANIIVLFVRHSAHNKVVRTVLKKYLGGSAPARQSEIIVDGNPGGKLILLFSARDTNQRPPQSPTEIIFLMDLSATFLGVTGFVLTILATCAVAYAYADRLEPWANAKLGKQSSKRG